MQKFFVKDNQIDGEIIEILICMIGITIVRKGI